MVRPAGPLAWDPDCYQRVGVSFLLPNHYHKLTGVENLRFFGSLYDGPTVNPMTLLGSVGLADAANTRVGKYSKGMQMRLTFANALVHQGLELEVMMGATLEQEAQWLADNACTSGFRNAGDPIGQVFGWLWRADPDNTMEWPAAYGFLIVTKFEERGWARLSFRVVWRALNVALGVSLTHEDIRGFEAYTREHLQDRHNPFTLDELAGRERPRADNDSWPDTTRSWKGWVKKRWRDVVVGDFVPNPGFAFELGVDDDHWCRVKQIDGYDVVLEHHDGGSSHQDRQTTVYRMVDAGSQWVPFQAEPYRWSY